MKKCIFLVKTVFAASFICLTSHFANAQTESELDRQTSFNVQKLYAEALNNPFGVALLRELTQDIGNRPAGSENYDKAAKWSSDQMTRLGLATSTLSTEITPWTRGIPASATFYADGKRRAIRCITLGNSPSTPENGIKADIVEVLSLDQLDSLGEAAISGKIVFFNRPFEAGTVNTGNAYGNAVDQRVFGPSRASKYGALGAIVRSMTPNLDAIPHTGTTIFEEGITPIPAIAISTLDAERIHEALAKSDVKTELFFRCGGKLLPKSSDDNVIGDWKGSEKADKIILIGAHLDSWDVGEGAHDDGTGCIHALETIRLLKSIGFTPKHTIRVVLFANEENGLNGAKTYWKHSESKELRHVAAIESDGGGFVPRGFSVDAPSSLVEKSSHLTKSMLPILEPYGLSFSKGGGGADIRGLKDQGAILFGLKVDGQRYFDLHHTEQDVFAAVHPREFQMGAAAIASLVMLLDAEL